MIRSLLLLAALATITSSAVQADVWKRAIEGEDLSRGVYDEAMRDGDDYVLQASSHSASKKQIKQSLDDALAAYRKAAAARPKEGEPYYRIATSLNSFYLESCEDRQFIGATPSPLRDCDDPISLNVPVAKEVIAAWDAFETRAPLDPRLGTGEGGILFARAILHTKLATKEHFALAVRDYERWLDRSDGSEPEVVARTWGNLAETYMMLGKMEEAIDAYREAVRGASDASTAYGYAVALDRDERAASALSLIVRQGPDSYRAFRERVMVGDTFFVPKGEEQYYFALIEEAYGNYAQSISHWRRFLASGAHPQFQPRAKAHLDALLVKQKTARPVVLPPDFEDY